MTAAISIGRHSVPGPIHKAIEQAANTTGMDFDYLMHQAKAESSFNPNARAKTSSAEGLYQFLDQTWLSMVKQHGDKYGMGDQAQQITKRNGRYTAPDDVRQSILDARRDPRLASAMAGELASQNKSYLQANTTDGVGDIGPVELYFAHFLGASGASKFLNAKATDGDQRATDIFPVAAQANKPVFYNPDGQARSLDQVYDFFAQKFDTDTRLADQPTITASMEKVDGQKLGGVKAGAEKFVGSKEYHPVFTRRSAQKMDQLSLMIQAQLMASLNDWSHRDDQEKMEQGRGHGWASVF